MSRRFVEEVRAAAFDLDGTLVDSAPDLALAANAMLCALGHPALAEERIAAAIGDGIDMLVARALAESSGQAPDARALSEAGSIFRERYAQRVFEASRVYPGVGEGLAALAARGLPLACITNKHSRFTAAVLEAAGLARWFALVLCADAPEQRKPGPYLLLEACRRLAIAPRELLYVGDSGLDVAAARAAGCPVVLVSYGYNRGRPASEAGADAVVASLAEVVEMRAPARHGGGAGAGTMRA